MVRTPGVPTDRRCAASPCASATHDRARGRRKDRRPAPARTHRWPVDGRRTSACTPRPYAVSAASDVVGYRPPKTFGRRQRDPERPKRRNASASRPQAPAAARARRETHTGLDISRRRSSIALAARGRQSRARADRAQQLADAERRESMPVRARSSSRMTSERRSVQSVCARCATSPCQQVRNGVAKGEPSPLTGT
jgi:hypothetical protein